MSFDAELANLARECVDLLGEGSPITITFKVGGAYDPATGRRALTTSGTATINAIRQADQVQHADQGGTMVQVRAITYFVATADLEGVTPDRIDTVTDEGVVLPLVSVEREINGHGYKLHVRGRV